MRICLYSETALPKLGGQELVVDSLARQLLELGHDVTVLAALPRRQWFVDDSSLPYRVVRHWPLFSTTRGVGWYRHALIKLYRSQPWDVLHCQSVYPCGYLAALAGVSIPAPVVITSHGGDIRAGNARIKKPGMISRFEQAVSYADALVAISRFTADGFRRLGATDAQIVSIANGVDLAPYRHPVARPAGLDAEIVPQQYLLFLGRLHRRKGVDTALEALARLAPRGGVEFVIAGDGDERAALEAHVERLHLRARVRFLGAVRGPLKTYLLQQARSVLLTSRGWEAFPLVVLEAFAAGVPVVGTLIPGLGDRIEAGQTGWLVEPDAPQELASVCEQILGSEAWRTLGEQARQSAANFSWSRVAEQHVALYQRLLKALPLPRRGLGS